MFHEHDKVNLTLFPPNLFFPRPLSRPRHPGKPSGRKPWNGSARLPCLTPRLRLGSTRHAAAAAPSRPLLLSIATALLRALATSHRTVLGSAPPGWTQSRPSRPALEQSLSGCHIVLSLDGHCRPLTRLGTDLRKPLAAPRNASKTPFFARITRTFPHKPQLAFTESSTSRTKSLHPSLKRLSTAPRSLPFLKPLHPRAFYFCRRI